MKTSLFILYLGNMIAPAENTLLIADPFLQDDHFIRSVIYLCCHDKEGTIGFKLNEFSGYSIHQMIKGLSQCRLPVYIGGPVANDTVHFLHSAPDLIPGGQHIGNQIYWGGDFSVVKQLLKDKSLHQQNIRFFLGYSGWSEGQLQQELEEKTWLTATSTKKIIFDIQPESVWKESVRLLGPDFLPIIHYPIDPQLN
jgi:putative transcriptional regulator